MVQAVSLCSFIAPDGIPVKVVDRSFAGFAELSAFVARLKASGLSRYYRWIQDNREDIERYTGCLNSAERPLAVNILKDLQQELDRRKEEEDRAQREREERSRREQAERERREQEERARQERQEREEQARKERQEQEKQRRKAKKATLAGKRKNLIAWRTRPWSLWMIFSTIPLPAVWTRRGAFSKCWEISGEKAELTPWWRPALPRLLSAGYPASPVFISDPTLFHLRLSDCVYGVLECCKIIGCCE